MVINYKKMDIGKLYRSYTDIENGKSQYITKFKGSDKHHRMMLAVYTLENDGKISRYLVGYLDKRDWGEPDFPIDGWSVSRDSENIEEELSHIGDPNYMTTIYTRYQGLEELTPLELELVSSELNDFFADPLTYLKSGNTK